MATAFIYNHTRFNFISGNNVGADTYKVALLNASATFNAAHTTLAQVTNNGANEVSGFGWAAGGMAIPNDNFQIVNTDEAAMTADNLEVVISGGDLGPFSHYVIFNDTDPNDPPLVFITLTAPQTVPDGNTIRFPWVNNRLFVFGDCP